MIQRSVIQRNVSDSCDDGVVVRPDVRFSATRPETGPQPDLRFSIPEPQVIDLREPLLGSDEGARATLGVSADATWPQIAAAHRLRLTRIDDAQDRRRGHAERHAVNSAYATLRLLSVSSLGPTVGC